MLDTGGAWTGRGRGELEDAVEESEELRYPLLRLLLLADAEGVEGADEDALLLLGELTVTGLWSFSEGLGGGLGLHPRDAKAAAAACCSLSRVVGDGKAGGAEASLAVL